LSDANSSPARYQTSDTLLQVPVGRKLEVGQCRVEIPMWVSGKKAFQQRLEVEGKGN
jgi:hypothetical protein